MNTQDTMDHSHAFAADGRRGWINSLGGAIELMTAFSREVRADDCNMDADGDMLLFQWGLSDCGGQSVLHVMTSGAR